MSISVQYFPSISVHIFHFPGLLRAFFALLEAVGIIADFLNIAVVIDLVEQRGGHLGITEDLRVTGNHSKLVAAEALLRVVRQSFALSCVLMDSWYMRGKLNIMRLCPKLCQPKKQL